MTDATVTQIAAQGGEISEVLSVGGPAVAIIVAIVGSVIALWRYAIGPGLDKLAAVIQNQRDAAASSRESAEASERAAEKASAAADRSHAAADRLVDAIEFLRQGGRS